MQYSETFKFFYYFAAAFVDGISKLGDWLFTVKTSELVALLPGGIGDIGSWFLSLVENLAGQVGIDYSLGLFLFSGSFAIIIMYKFWRFILTCVPALG